MKRHLILALLAALAFTACTPKTEDAASKPSADNASTSASAAASDAETMAAAEAAAKASTDPASAVTTQAPKADSSAAPAAAPQPAAATTGIPGLIAGTDYEEIPNGQPFDPLDGKLEVVEVFNFVCPACAGFQPLIMSWKKKLPGDVRFTYVPAAFGGNWDQYVRAYYAAQTMGIAEKTHESTYEAIHIKRTLKGERGEDSDEDISNFYAQFGADPKQFASGMRSFAVSAKFNKAKQYIVEGRVNSTPTLIINGRYKVRGKTSEDVFRIADQLMAYTRAQTAVKKP